MVTFKSMSLALWMDILLMSISITTQIFSFGKYWFTELCRSSKRWHTSNDTKESIEVAIYLSYKVLGSCWTRGGEFRFYSMVRWWRIYLPMQETQEARVQFLGREDPLEEEMATHSGILVWKIPWTEEDYSPWCHKESDMTEWLRTIFSWKFNLNHSKKKKISCFPWNKGLTLLISNTMSAKYPSLNNHD